MAMTGVRRTIDSSEATSESSTLGTAMTNSGADHFSQNSSFQLTSHRLNGKNYLEWAQSVKLAIDGWGKLGHLTVEVKQPAVGDPNRNT